MIKYLNKQLNQFLNKLLLWVYNKLDKRFSKKEDTLLDDYKFFTGSREIHLQEYKKTIQSVPESILLKLIDMINFFKYISYCDTQKGYNPKTVLEQEVLSGEMKGIQRTFDWFIELLEGGLPDRNDKYDGLTNTKIGEIEMVLKRTFQERKNSIESLIKEFDKQAK